MGRLRETIAAGLRHQAAGGVLLLGAALTALVLKNTPAAGGYDALLAVPLGVAAGDFVLQKPLVLWINDFLMAIFFLLVGLEIKREVLEGQLSSWAAAGLPLAAAVGGMAVPMAIYAGLNWNDATALRGWAIPAATDIAFALGILAMVGPGVPRALKVFLLALAVIDDLGAIIIIAVFYSTELSLPMLAAAVAGIGILAGLNRLGVRSLVPYLLIGLVIWVLVLKSGVHATLAGVAVALCVPASRRGTGEPPLQRLEHAIAPWVGLGIMPIFAFANAGVSVAGMSVADMLAPVPLGVALGLFLGKQIGVMGFSWAFVRLGGRLPAGMGWGHLYGLSLLAGIGFTVSLFIGNLAFSQPDLTAAVRLGVLLGSTVSAVIGYWVLRWLARRAPRPVLERDPFTSVHGQPSNVLVVEDDASAR